MIVTNNAINNIQDTELPIGALAYFSTGGTDTTYMNQWLKCDGSTYSQSAYPVLFSRLGLINPNGSIWTLSTFTTTATVAVALAYGNGVYCLLTSGLVYTSTDRLSWTLRGSIFPQVPTSLTFGNGLFVMGGQAGIIYTSTLGQTWTSQTSGTATSITQVSYANGNYFFTAGTSLFTATNAQAWSFVTTFASGPHNVLYQNGVYSINTSTAIYSTINFSTFTLRTSGITIPSAPNTGIGLAATNNISMCIGNTNFVLTATDNLAWQLQTSSISPFTSTLNPSTFIAGENVFLLGYPNGVIQTTIDGLTYNKCILPTLTAASYTSQVGALLYANNEYLATIGNQLLVSANTYPYNPATQFQVPLDNQTSCFQQSVKAFPRSLYIRALT